MQKANPYKNYDHWPGTLSGVIGGALRHRAVRRLVTPQRSIVILMLLRLCNCGQHRHVAFSRYVTPAALTGQAFAIFCIIVAAAVVTQWDWLSHRRFPPLELIDVIKTTCEVVA
jgi:hypothetical protein